MRSGRASYGIARPLNCGVRRQRVRRTPRLPTARSSSADPFGCCPQKVLAMAQWYGPFSNRLSGFGLSNNSGMAVVPPFCAQWFRSVLAAHGQRRPPILLVCRDRVVLCHNCAWSGHRCCCWLGAVVLKALCQPPNKQLQRTVTRRRGRAARALFHYARASRFTRQRAAAELRR